MSGAEVEVDGTLFQAQPRQSPGVLGPEAEAAQRDHQAQPGKVDLAVLAVAVVTALRGGQDPDLLVPTHGARRDSGTASEFGYLM